MVSNSGDLLSYFNGAINDMLQKRTEAFDTPAEIVRIEGDTAWVHMPGGVDETPVQLTVNAKEGDTVQVRVGGGSAWLTGNATAPPTDDTTAIQARTVANTAQEVAQEAQMVAEESMVVAGSAMESADGKNTIYRQPDIPTGGDYKVGDTWFDTNDGNKIYLWDGTAWDSALIGTNAIADAAITNAKVSNLDAGKITTGELAAARIDVDDLFAQNITATGTISGVTLIGSAGQFTESFEVDKIVTESGSLPYRYQINIGGREMFFGSSIKGTNDQWAVIPYMRLNVGASYNFSEAEFGVGDRNIYPDSFSGVYIVGATGVRVTSATDLKLKAGTALTGYIYLESNTHISGDLYLESDEYISGNLEIGDASVSADVYAELVTSARSVKLLNDNASVGLYDEGNSEWIIRSTSARAVYVPHNLRIGDTSLNGVNMQLISGTRNGGVNLSSADNFGLYDNTNSSWVIRSSGGQASGETLGDVFIPHPLNVGGRLSAPNIVCGTVTITPSAADTPTGQAVTWANMGGTPFVVATARTTAPGTVVKAVSVYNKSATGCTIYVTRSNTTATPIDYIAIY